MAKKLTKEEKERQDKEDAAWDMLIKGAGHKSLGGLLLARMGGPRKAKKGLEGK